MGVASCLFGESQEAPCQGRCRQWAVIVQAAGMLQVPDSGKPP